MIHGNRAIVPHLAVRAAAASSPPGPGSNHRGNPIKLQFSTLAGGFIASIAALSAWAQPDATPARLGIETGVRDFDRIRINNVQDESLGRIMDLRIELVHGTIAEMVVVSDNSPETGPKTAAVPARNPVSAPLNGPRRLIVSIDVIKSAPAVGLSEWFDSGPGDRVAAAGRVPGQEPYFAEEPAAVEKSASRRQLLFDDVRRSSPGKRLLVGNLQNQRFGEVYAMILDIPHCRIRSFVVLAPGSFETRSIIPAVTPTVAEYSRPRFPGIPAREWTPVLPLLPGRIPAFVGPDGGPRRDQLDDPTAPHKEAGGPSPMPKLADHL